MKVRFMIDFEWDLNKAKNESTETSCGLQRGGHRFKG